LAILGCLLPAYAALIFPAVPLFYLGDVGPPAILLSNFMAKRATYQSFYIVGFGIPMVVGVFLVGEAGRHLSDHGVRRAGINAWMGLVVGMCGTGLLTLLAFNFEEETGNWESRLHAVAHNIGTIMYFAGAGAGGFVYTAYVLPEAERKGAIHPADAAWTRTLGWQISRGTLIAAAVRGLHLTWPLTWAYPMLVIECYVIGLGISLCVLGNFRMLMLLDGTEPLLDFQFLSDDKDGKES